MEWDEELFVEARETLSLMAPREGTWPELAEFQRGDVIEQNVVRRKDYLGDTWCHINSARAARPFTFRSRPVETLEKRCIFCPGAEGMTARDVNTAGDTLRVGNRDWTLRVFPNLYPWLNEHRNVVETSSHKFTLADLDVEEEANALRAMQELSRRFLGAGLFPVIFKNQGFGASIYHYHWQAGALPRLPTRILREMGIASRFLDRWQKNIFDAIIESEQCRGVRVVADTSRVFVLAPFSPRTNGEVWLIWKKPIVNLAECEDEDLRLLASLLVEVLKALNTELKIENLCVVVNQVPRDPAYRLHLKVLPFKSWAGGERGFDEYSVEVAPERVAAALGPVLRSGEVIS